MIAQASSTDPRDFYQIRRFYGNNSEVFEMRCPDCFEGNQSIAIMQYLGHELWDVQIDIWQ